MVTEATGATEAPKQLKLFYCYARADKAYRDELDNHLSGLKRSHQIASWSDREISPGLEWATAIDKELNTAHIILLLVSASFMASDYCYGIEMKRALERHEAGEARVVPILLRAVDWEDAPFSKLQVLPTDAKPVSRWQDRDEAFWDIARNLRQVVKELLISLKTEEDLLEESIALNELKRYEEALIAFEQCIKLNPTSGKAYGKKGWTLNELARHQEALAALDQALQLGYTDNGWTYSEKGWTLNKLERYQEALAALDQALQLDYTDNGWTYGEKGYSLNQLGRYKEALVALDQALQLGYTNDGWTQRQKILL